MNRRVAIACPLFAWLLVMAPLMLRAEEGEATTLHSLRIEVLLVQSDGQLDEASRRALSGPRDGIMKTLKALQDQGKATIVNHAELTLLENQKTQLQVGEAVSVPSAAMRLPDGRQSRSYQTLEVGTLIQLMSQVIDDRVVVQLEFEKSYLTPRTDDDPDRPVARSQLTQQSTLQIKNGHGQLAGRMMSRQPDGEIRESQLIVSVDVLEPPADGQTARFRMFSTPPGLRPPGGRPPVAERSPAPLPSGRPARAPLSPDEMRNRMAGTIFARADTNGDGLISELELPRLNPRDVDARPPITKEQYAQWLLENWPRRGGPGRADAPSAIVEGSTRQTETSQPSEEDDDDDDDDDR
jgi:hypothetical protein